MKSVALSITVAEDGIDHEFILTAVEMGAEILVGATHRTWDTGNGQYNRLTDEKRSAYVPKNELVIMAMKAHNWISNASSGASVGDYSIDLG